MLMPGPNKKSILLRMSSFPSNTYKSSTNGWFHVHARHVPLGSEVAIAPLSIRIPEGPSEHAASGNPNPSKFCVTPPKAEATPGVTLGLLIPSPRTKHAKS